MRPSPLLHPVAVLRVTIQLGQKGLAELCGCSSRTIQAIELLKLKLSEQLALKLSQATGVSAEWLLNADPKIPPFCREALLGDAVENGGFTKRSFELHRAILSVPSIADADEAKLAAWMKAPANDPYKTVDMAIHPALVAIMAEGGDVLPNQDFWADSLRDGKSPVLSQMPLPVAKANLRFFESVFLEARDASIVRSLRQLLQKTSGHPASALIRWKLEKCIRDLNAQYGVPAAAQGGEKSHES